MKLAVIGSQTFTDYPLLLAKVKELNPSLIVSGGAKGADKLGERAADELNIPKLIFLPDWEKYGKAAGFIRNRDIVANAEVVLAFWDGASKGTKNSLDLARKLNKKCIVLSST
jgi:hypothetical protein